MFNQKKIQIEVFVKVLMLSLISVIVLQTGMTATAGDKYFVTHTYGGRFGGWQKEAFFDPFTEETGIEVKTVTAGADAWGKVAAQIRSRNIEWDMTSSSYVTDMMAAVKKGLVDEVDYDAVTNAKELVPGAAAKYGLATGIVSYVITYNTEAFPEGKQPKSWADFFNVEKFPGPRAMHNWGNPDLVIFSALLADGVSPEKLVPIDFDRAFRKLDQIKKHVRVWYSSGDQLTQALMSGEVVLANAIIGRALGAKKSGARIAIEWNQAMSSMSYWCLVKGAPRKEEALQFLNFLCRPEAQARFTKLYPISPTNPKALEYLPPETRKDQVIHPDNFQNSIDIPKYVMPWTMDHWDEIVEKYNTWLGM